MLESSDLVPLIATRFLILAIRCIHIVDTGTETMVVGEDITPEEITRSCGVSLMRKLFR